MYTIKPLKKQFDDPLYPVLVEISQGSKLVSEVVIVEHDRLLGKFDFGKLEPIISRLPKTEVNRLKEEIKKEIFLEE